MADQTDERLAQEWQGNHDVVLHFKAQNDLFALLQRVRSDARSAERQEAVRIIERSGLNRETKAGIIRRLKERAQAPTGGEG